MGLCTDFSIGGPSLYGNYGCLKAIFLVSEVKRSEKSEWGPKTSESV